ncbi:MAG: DUF1836 domain-containing protein [Lachnospiraceae bacterium]
MTINTEDMLNSILESLSRIAYIKPSEIPNIDLYMDQVTTFMESQLSPTKRYPSDKVLTKTMINNYAKNNLLPPPIKKKYTNEHILVLIFVYYFKNLLSIKDIEALLKPITEKYFNTDEDFNLTAIYEEVCSLEASRIEIVTADIKKAYEAAQDTFTDAKEEDQNFLHLFTFVCSLSLDVYIKKQLIEKIIDQLPNPDSKKTKK